MILCISGSTASNLFTLSKVLGGGGSVAVSGIGLYIHVDRYQLGTCCLYSDMSRHVCRVIYDDARCHVIMYMGRDRSRPIMNCVYMLW